MNVLYIVNSMTLREGSVKSLLTLVRGMLGKGVCVTIVTQGKNEIYKYLLDWSVNVYALPFRISVYPKSSNIKDKILFFPRIIYWQILNFYSYFKLIGIARNCHIDLIHTNVSIIDIGFKVARYLKIPHIYHIREYVDKDFKLRFFPNKAHFINQLKDNDSYSICITQDVQRHHNLSGLKNSFVIYNGIFHSKQTYANYAKERYFLYVGRIEQPKGLYFLVKAYYGYLLTASVSPVPLIVVGDISDIAYYSEILRFVRSSGISEYIRFLGGRDDVVKQMRHALAIVIPSVFEGFGRCMAEAMFNGCLVIGHNTGGVKEQFDNGKAFCGKEIGLRYDTNEQLTKHLIDVSNASSGFYNGMIRRASEVVSNLYSIEKYVDGVYNMYVDVLKGVGV